jgi:hypothetical protein
MKNHSSWIRLDFLFQDTAEIVRRNIILYCSLSSLYCISFYTIEIVRKCPLLHSTRTGEGIFTFNELRSIPPAYVAWRADTATLYIPTRFLEPIDCSKIPAQYDNPIPTRLLAPIDCSKIPALSGF